MMTRFLFILVHVQMFDPSLRLYSSAFHRTYAAIVLTCTIHDDHFTAGLIGAPTFAFRPQPKC